MSNYLNLILLLLPVFAAALYIFIKNRRSINSTKPVSDIKSKNNNSVFQDLGYQEAPPTTETTLKKTTAPLLKEDIFMVYLIAHPEKDFAGYELIETFLNLNLRHGENELFHRLDEQGEILFSVARTTKTGSFDLDQLADIRCRGLIFFMYPKAENADRVLEELLLTAQQCASSLGGYLQDARKQALSKEVIDYYRERFTTV